MPEIDDVAHVDGTAQMDMQGTLNLAAPQPMYRQVLEGEGIVRPTEGVAIIDRPRAHRLRAAPPRAVLVGPRRDDLGNVRPLIPLNVDPPNHSQVPQADGPAVRAQAHGRAGSRHQQRRVNEFIDAFVDRGECNFTEEFAELFPSSVFLGLMGLPESDLRIMLPHPRRQPPPGQDRSEGDGRRRGAASGDGRQRHRDLRLLHHAARRARAAPDRRHPHALPAGGDRRRTASPARTSSTRCSCSSSPGSTP